jgi:hypothetical protein
MSLLIIKIMLIVPPIVSHFTGVEVGVESIKNFTLYAGGSFTTGRISLIRQAEKFLSDEEK